MDNLVGQNPRDEIILLREESLRQIKKAKLDESAYSRDLVLKKFSKQFFKDDGMFDRLNALQKRELAKFCLSHCRKWLAGLTLSIGGSLAAILSLGSFLNSGWFIALIPWVIISLVSICSIGVTKDGRDHVNIEHFLPFIMKQKKIEQEEKRMKRQIRSGDPKNE